MVAPSEPGGLGHQSIRLREQETITSFEGSKGDGESPIFISYIISSCFY